MSALALFSYEDQQIRTVTLDGEAMFVLADVCRVLDLANPSMVAARLDGNDLSTAEVIDSMGRKQMARTVSRFGVFDAVMLSRKPGARAFKRWVTHEVIPSIEATGAYSMTPAAPALPQSFAEALELAARQARELEAREAELAVATPKVEAFDAFMDADGYYSMAEAARMLGLGRTTFFQRLREEGIFQRGANLPYREYDRYFFMSPGTRPTRDGGTAATLTPRVRPEGIDWLRIRLRAEGLPSGLVALTGGA